VLDPERVIGVIVDVLDRVWTFGTKQFGAGLRVRVACRRDVDPWLVCWEVPQASRAIDDHHAWMLVGVLRFRCAGGHDDLKDPNASLIYEDTVGYRSSRDTVKLIGPGPGGRFQAHRAKITLRAHSPGCASLSSQRAGVQSTPTSPDVRHGRIILVGLALVASGLFKPVACVACGAEVGRRDRWLTKVLS
jgi:hypothetical protein